MQLASINESCCRSEQLHCYCNLLPPLLPQLQLPMAAAAVTVTGTAQGMLEPVSWASAALAKEAAETTQKGIETARVPLCCALGIIRQRLHHLPASDSI